MDTTIASIGNLIALFAAFPDQFDLVRADPALVPSAFAEVLRYWAPLHAWGRAVTRDVEIDGHLIPGGSQAAVLLGSGNRDPRHYDDPDAFRVARNPVDHLSFGYGVHFCLGAALARMELNRLFTELVPRLASIELAGTPEYSATTFVGGLKHLPIRYSLR